MFLLIDSIEESLLATRRMLYANNIITVGCGYRDLPNLLDLSKIDAVILVNPYDKNMPHHFPYTCHTRFPKIPIIGIKQPLRRDTEDMRAYDILLSIDLPPKKMIDAMILEVSRYHGRDVADHMKGLARDHILMEDPRWCDTPIHLTQAERMIFQYLIDAYPRPVSVKELLRYCMKPGTSPLHCNIPTHIYHINQKARKEYGYPFIHCPGGIGYQLLLYDSYSSKTSL